MIVLRPIEIMNVLQNAIAIEFEARKYSGKFPAFFVEALQKAAKSIQEFSQSLELPVTEATARNMVTRADTPEKLRSAMKQLGDTLFMELDNRKFYGPLEKFTKYFEQQQLFGDEVFNAFPSANDDIYEAGTCLALERATACVMHLNRALECCLVALAKAVGVAKQNDWGSYTREISKELDARAKAAGARSADEQFYAEASANFDRLRPDRNPTMHPEKTYLQDQAEEVFLASKAFMIHLATRLSE